MVFRDETAMEVDFFEEAFNRFATGDVRRVLEPGCGSGRLVVAMAERGYDVTGLDLSQPMLQYLRRRLKRRGLNAATVLGDMTEMQFDRKFDAAFCTFNTFRHLMSDADAIKHLRCVAEHLRKGGLYILGFHCIPLDADEDCIERWKASSGGTKVSATLRVLDFDRASRQEVLRVSIKATKRNGKIERIRTDFPLRLYTHDQAEALLNQVADQFEIASLYDFGYDIHWPVELDEDLADAVFVLRRI
ncbi:MAG: class I SAM-dependent methyltransferase [Pirellulaceae bacterium]|nr:class I SAM-dependent methyltransferase [Pirellulaceae bacterium]